MSSLSVSSVSSSTTILFSLVVDVEQLESQIQRIQAQQSKEEVPQSSEEVQQSAATKDPYSNNILDVLA